MSWGLVASAGASIVGGMMAGDAAGDAADAQSAAADRASATQERARVQQRTDLMPWMQGGQQANNALLYRLGLGGSGGAGGGGLTRDQLRNQLVGQFTTTTQGTTPNIPVGANAVAGVKDGQQGYYVENYQGGSEFVPMGQATQGTSSIDEAGLNAAIDARFNAQGQGNPNDPAYGSLLRKFDQSDLNSDLVFQNTYKTALDTGTNALNSRAANSGNWGSGAALKALTRFGANTANAYTGDAYNRNMGEKAQTYNFFGGVSQQGQSAAAGVGAAGISTANGIAGNQLAAGNAQSAGIIGGANALTGGIADATNAYQWNQLMSRPKTASSGGWGTGTSYGNQDLGSYL